jgi:hypothetical protein
MFRHIVVLGMIWEWEVSFTPKKDPSIPIEYGAGGAPESFWVVPTCSLVVGVKVSEAMLPPSSGLNCVVKEMYSLHYCLHRQVLFLRRENLE